MVAKDGSGRLLGCGQLKPHGGGVVELASIAVEPDSRGQGIARAIIEHLLAQPPRPVYLTCRSSLGSFYERWGFQAIILDEMPPYFRRLARLVSLMTAGAWRGESMLVMRMH